MNNLDFIKMKDICNCVKNTINRVKRPITLEKGISLYLQQMTHLKIRQINMEKQIAQLSNVRQTWSDTAQKTTMIRQYL